jgi:hypothetical protein
VEDKTPLLFEEAESLRIHLELALKHDHRYMSSDLIQANVTRVLGHGQIKNMFL